MSRNSTGAAKGDPKPADVSRDLGRQRRSLASETHVNPERAEARRIAILSGATAEPRESPGKGGPSRNLHGFQAAVPPWMSVFRTNVEHPGHEVDHVAPSAKHASPQKGTDGLDCEVFA